MKTKESPVVFDCDGDRLIGILTLPDAPSSLGVLIVVGGPQYRVGSHRQFVDLARALTHEGYPTFRFDYRGMGDSEGAMRTFEDVEPDIHAAAQAFRTACPKIERLVAFGLCDAASAVLMAAERIDGLTGMILANPWVRRAETLNAAVVRHYYRQRILSAEFWRKFATGRLHFGSAIAEFVRRVFGWLAANPRSPSSAPADFIERMLSGWRLPIAKLLLLSERDITAREFDDLRSADERWALSHDTTFLVEARLAGADHTFSTARWRDDAVAHCVRYLENLAESPHRTAGNAR
jgi:exosortase A-associated hydrolase 1